MTSQVNVDNIGTPDGSVVHRVAELISSADISKEFTTMDELKADSTLEAGKFVRTSSWYDPKFGGGNTYSLHPSGTFTPKQGLVIDLPNSGLQAVGLFNEGIPRASQLGADPRLNKNEDTTVNTLAIQSMIDYTESLIADLSYSAVLGCFVDNTYVINGSLSTSQEGLLISYGGYLNIADDFPLEGVAMVAGANNSYHYNFKMSGNSLASGIDVKGGSVQMISPRMDHIRGFGIWLGGAFGDSNIHDPDISEWSLGDPEYEDDSNFVSRCIVFDRADCNLFGGRTYWAQECIYCTSNAFTTYIRGHHPFNGRAGTTTNPRVDPKVLTMESGATGIHMSNCYLDNGQLDLYSDSLKLTDCNFLVNSDAVNYSDNRIIGVFNSGSGDPSNLEIDTHVPGNLAGNQLIKYIDTAEGNWTGDYSGLDSNNPRGNFTATAGKQEVFHRPGGGFTYKKLFKPDGFIQYEFQIGTFAPTLINIFEDLIAFQQMSMRVNSGNNDSELLLGFENNGVFTRNNEETGLRSGDGSNEVILTSTGSLRPGSHQQQDMGTETQNYRKGYFQELDSNSVRSNEFRFSVTGPTWVSGSGDPEGAVSASVGSLYSRTDGGAGTTLYVKESGTSNTGWIAK